MIIIATRWEENWKFTFINILVYEMALSGKPRNDSLLVQGVVAMKGGVGNTGPNILHARDIEGPLHFEGALNCQELQTIG